MVSIEYPYTIDTTVSVSDTVSVSVSDTVNKDSSKHNLVKDNTTAKASKHKYGEYQNVLLKDEELQRLQNDYENWEELIAYLDTYIEMKGYKAKSHYLCIKKWVVDAVAEKKQRKSKTSEKRGVTFADLLREEYGDDKERDSGDNVDNADILSEVLPEYDIE